MFTTRASETVRDWVLLNHRQGFHSPVSWWGGGWFCEYIDVKQCRTTHTHTLTHTPPHTHKSAHENWGMSGDVSGKVPACQCKLEVRDTGSIPGWERSPGEGNGNPLQYSCLETKAWAEEPGRLQSLGSHRVGHDWSDLAHPLKVKSIVPMSFSCLDTVYAVILSPLVTCDNV